MEAENAQRVLIAGEIHAIDIERGHLGERLAQAAIIEEIERRGIRLRQFEHGHVLGHDHELIGIFKMQWMQDNGVDG